MYHKQENAEPDELRARFTVWMEILLYRARLKYLRKENRRIPTISLDELAEEGVITADPDVFRDPFQGETKSFEFEEERLAKAFADLPIKRQRILEMLFLEEKKPQQIARELNCSEAYVYNEKHRALKKLREAIKKDGEASVTRGPAIKKAGR